MERMGIFKTSYKNYILENKILFDNNKNEKIKMKRIDLDNLLIWDPRNKEKKDFKILFSSFIEEGFKKGQEKYN